MSYENKNKRTMRHYDILILRHMKLHAYIATTSAQETILVYTELFKHRSPTATPNGNGVAKISKKFKNIKNKTHVIKCIICIFRRF